MKYAVIQHHRNQWNQRDVYRKKSQKPNKMSETRTKVATPTLSKSVIYRVHPAMFHRKYQLFIRENERKQNHLIALPDNYQDMKRLKVVLGQFDYHLSFPVVFWMSKQNESRAVRTKLVLAVCGLVPKCEMAQYEQQAVSYLKLMDCENSCIPGAHNVIGPQTI